jgi:hypothetical protein
MAKKQTVDRAAGGSPMITPRRKGRQRSPRMSANLPAAPAAAEDNIDRTNDNAPAAEARSVTVEETSGSSEGNLVTSEPSLETKVPAARPNIRRAQLIGLLERPEGAPVGEIAERLGWLPHTVRAALTGLRHAGCEVSRDKDGEGWSIYRLHPGGGIRPMTPLMAPRSQADQAGRPRPSVPRQAGPQPR